MDKRKISYDNIWRNQVLLSKVSNISMETSDTFTKEEYEHTFEVLKQFADELNKQ